MVERPEIDRANKIARILATEVAAEVERSGRV
jgi:hypothetical protein